MPRCHRDTFRSTEANAGFGGDQPKLSISTRFDGNIPGVKFSDVFPDVKFAETEIDQAYLTARLTRAISLDVAQKFKFPAFELCEMDRYEAEPEITGKPVRGVLSRRAKVHKGWFHLHRTDETVAWESQPELSALTRIDCMTGAASIVTQPVTIEYDCPVTHRRRSAYPDIYLTLNGYPLLLEIKKDFNRLKQAEAVRFVLLEKLFARAGVSYRGWDESDIRAEPEFGNALWLARYESIRLENPDRLAILRLFQDESVMPLSRLSDSLEDKNQLRSFAMILRGWLIAERDVSVRDDPRVMLGISLTGGGHEGSR